MAQVVPADPVDPAAPQFRAKAPQAIQVALAAQGVLADLEVRAVPADRVDRWVPEALAVLAGRVGHQFRTKVPQAIPAARMVPVDRVAQEVRVDPAGLTIREDPLALMELAAQEAPVVLAAPVV